MLPPSAGPKLTSEQKAAVATDARFALVLAGPGSGKTHTLVARAAELVRRGVAPGAILAVTFAREAAKEAGERLQAAGVPATAATFHSYAARLIQRDPAGYGLSGRWSFWSEGDYLDAMRDAAEEHAPAWVLRTRVADLVREAKERMGDLRAVCAAHPDLDAEHRKMLKACLAGYERRRAAASALDFADVAPMVVRRMQADRAYRRSVAGALQELLVDEFQDLDPSQAALLDQLVAEGARLWAVGDDDQCLYGFRSADPRRLVRFGAHFPGAVVFALPGNHRSGFGIVEAAQDLIANNRARAARPRQRSMIRTKGAVHRHEFDTEAEEAEHLLRVVRRAVADGLSAAVLARSDWRLRAFRSRLRTLPGEAPPVEAMTVHKAKGRQWDVVALVGFEKGTMPEPRARDHEEERRIAYVGMTRARSGLHLTAVKRLGNDLFARRPGPFWDEAGARPGGTGLSGLRNGQGGPKAGNWVTGPDSPAPSWRRRG